MRDFLIVIAVWTYVGLYALELFMRYCPLSAGIG